MAIIAFAGVGLALAIWRAMHPAPLSPSVVLNDGTRVTLHSVTRGTNHLADSRTLSQKALEWAPQRLIPKSWIGPMPRRQVRREIQTATNATVLWLFMDKAPKARSYTVTDTNGMGGFISEPRTVTPSAGLFPLVLEDWPRRDAQIAVTFLGEYGTDRKLQGRLVIPNPERSKSEIVADGSGRLKAVDGSLGLELVSLETLPEEKPFPTRAGEHWACRARFRITEGGAPARDWVVQTLWLSDSGGNRRRATGPRGWTNDVFEIFAAPLFHDDPDWKLEADLTRVANFGAEEMVTFSGVPMPTRGSPEDAPFHTNLLGQAVTLRSMREAKAKMLAGGFHSMGAPGFVAEVDSRDPVWVPKIVSIRSEEGAKEELRPPAHGYGDGYAVMRFSVPQGRVEPRFLTVRMTIQMRRKFEMWTRAKVVEQP